MATSPDFARFAGSASRALADTVFDDLREAVVVVDARLMHLPVVLGNAAARRCFFGEREAASLVDASLYSLLGPATESAVDSVLGLQASGKRSVTRMLPWCFPHGELAVSTELKLLADPGNPRLVMLTFGEPSVESGLVSAIEQLPLDLLILDRELTVTYANAGATRTAGAPPGGILSYSALTLIPTATIPREVFERALGGVQYHDGAISVNAPGGPARRFEVDVQPLKDSSGVVGLAVLSMELTERRVRKQASSGIENRLLALTEHARDIITVVGNDERVQYVSGGIRNSLGYSVEERRTHLLFEHVHPDDVTPIRARFAQLVSGAISTFSQQFRVLHKEGSYRWLESSYVSALDNPLIRGVVVNSRDITERKHAESQLAQREEVFKLAADAVNGVIFEWDLARGVVHRSRGVLEVLGLEAAELAPAGAWSARIHPEDVPGYSKSIATALDNGTGWTSTYRIRDARGRYLSMLERGLIQRTAAGVPLRAIGCCVDVSEIKRLTDLLAETQRAAKMGGWEYSYATCELTWTDEMFRIYDTTPEEFEVSWDSMLAQCVPESRRWFDTASAAAVAADGDFDIQLELEIMTLKNQRLWVRIIGHVEKLDGRPFRAFGSVQNVQAPKTAQIALENSTGWLKLSMNMAHLHAWRWDRATDTLEFAIVDGQMVNLPRFFPGMKKLIARVHPKDRATVRQAIERAFECHTEVHHEFRLKSHDGRYRSYAAVARPLFDAADRPSGLVGVTQDVTARHEAEARLRRSEELLRVTTANTADTLLLVDTELRIRFINRAACGMSIDAIIGRDISVLLPDASRLAVTDKLHQVLMTGKTATYEYDVEADGATQYFENRAVRVRDDGCGTGISITIRNITERKRLEQEILDVSSRERQTIGRDLHDGLGQELTGVALMLRGLATRIQRQCPEAVGPVNEIVVLVNQSIETARALARGLLPVDTESGGLPGALRALADRSRDLYGFEVDFRLEVSPAVALGETCASHLYRIAQEALTNTARHSHAATVGLYLRINKSRFLLQIADDGVGIGEGSGAVSGMGLKIMKYRASMIGAKFEIVPNHPRGTVVRVTGAQPMVMTALQSAHAI